MFCAGLDFYAVFLVAGRGEGGLARATAGHLGLDVVFGEGEAGRDAVDNAADGAAMGFAVGCYAEELAECRHGGGVVIVNGGADESILKEFLKVDCFARRSRSVIDRGPRGRDSLTSFVGHRDINSINTSTSFVLVPPACS